MLISLALAVALAVAPVDLLGFQMSTFSLSSGWVGLRAASTGYAVVPCRVSLQVPARPCLLACLLACLPACPLVSVTGWRVFNAQTGNHDVRTELTARQ